MRYGRVGWSKEPRSGSGVRVVMKVERARDQFKLLRIELEDVGKGNGSRSKSMVQLDNCI